MLRIALISFLLILSCSDIVEDKPRANPLDEESNVQLSFIINNIVDGDSLEFRREYVYKALILGSDKKDYSHLVDHFEWKINSKAFSANVQDLRFELLLGSNTIHSLRAIMSNKAVLSLDKNFVLHVKKISISNVTFNITQNEKFDFGVDKFVEPQIILLDSVNSSDVISYSWSSNIYSKLNLVNESLNIKYLIAGDHKLLFRYTLSDGVPRYTNLFVHINALPIEFNLISPSQNEEFNFLDNILFNLDIKTNGMAIGPSNIEWKSDLYGKLNVKDVSFAINKTLKAAMHKIAVSFTMADSTKYVIEKNIVIKPIPITYEIKNPIKEYSIYDNIPFDIEILNGNEMIDPVSITWTSSIDGVFGEGSVSFNALKKFKLGNHSVTASFIMEDSKEYQKKFNLNVTHIGQSVSLPFAFFPFKEEIFLFSNKIYHIKHDQLISERDADFSHYKIIPHENYYLGFNFVNRSAKKYPKISFYGDGIEYTTNLFKDINQSTGENLTSHTLRNEFLANDKLFLFMNNAFFNVGNDYMLTLNNSGDIVNRVNIDSLINTVGVESYITNVTFAKNSIFFLSSKNGDFSQLNKMSLSGDEFSKVMEFNNGNYIIKYIESLDQIIVVRTNYHSTDRWLFSSSGDLITSKANDLERSSTLRVKENAIYTYNNEHSISKIDFQLNKIWTYNLAGVNINSFSEDGESIIIAGDQRFSGNLYDGIIIKLDNNGNQVFKHVFVADYDEFFRDIKVLNNEYWAFGYSSIYLTKLWKVVMSKDGEIK